MKIEIKSKNSGGELTNICVNGEERLHDGINSWNRHSPILFPIVGRLKNDKTLINGTGFEMCQHGFARNMEFENIQHTRNLQEYVLKSNKETNKKYPFDFELYIKYSIEDDFVVTQYRVVNKDNIDMPFGIGGHPAYTVDYSNCYIEFENTENNIEIYRLTDGLISYKEEIRNLFTDNKKIFLNSDSFINDAIILKNISSNKLYVKEKSTGKTLIELDFTGFPYLGIWSKSNAPFLCLEPWYTTADYTTSDGTFSEKPGTINLKSNEEFICEYKVRFF